MNKPIICVASGPSFSLEQAAMIVKAREEDRCRVIVVNDNWRRVPNADVLYACDGVWWDYNIEAVLDGFPGELWTQNVAAAKTHDLCYIKCVQQPGLSLAPDVIHMSSHGGYQAMGLAYHFGTRNDQRDMLLVGYDMKKTYSKDHWFGPHREGLSQTLPFKYWLKDFPKFAADLTAAGWRVWNCTIESALDCFPQAELASFIG